MKHKFFGKLFSTFLLSFTVGTLFLGCDRGVDTPAANDAAPENTRPVLALAADGLVTSQGAPYTGIWTLEFSDKPGSDRFRVPFVDGRIHGAILQFSRGGSVEREYHYRKGKWQNLLGRYSAANEPTAPWGPLMFATNLQPEESPAFDPVLTAEQFYERIEEVCLGALIGPHLRWFQDGGLEAYNVYNGKGGFDGVAVEYESDGSVKAKLRFKDGMLAEVLEETPEHKAARIEAGLIPVSE